MSKKGMEMSINIVVGLILGILMLSAGLLLFNKILFNANNIEKEVDEETKARIYQALDTGDPIYVPVSSVKVEKNYAQFVVGVRNIDGEVGNFKIAVTPQQYSGNPDAFNQDSEDRITVSAEPYVINAKDNELIYVLVYMKGITKKVTLHVDITKEEGAGTGNYVQYAKPKLVTIQP